jgi:PAS domain S-box-containing protein
LKPSATASVTDLVHHLLETEQRLTALVCATEQPIAGDTSVTCGPDLAQRTITACALLDAQGIIVRASSSWLSSRSLAELFLQETAPPVGAGFLGHLERSGRAALSNAPDLAAGIDKVLVGALASFTWHFEAHPADRRRIDIYRLEGNGPSCAAVTLVDEIAESAPSTESGDKPGREVVASRQASTGIAHIALSGTHIDVNARFCEMTGYGREELLRLRMIDLIAPEDRELCERIRAEMFDSQAPIGGIEIRYRCRDGSRIWVHLKTTLVRDQRGKPIHFVTAIDAVAEGGRADRRLARLNRLYTVLRRIGEAIVDTNEREQLFASACRIGVESGGLRMVMVVEIIDGKVVPVSHFGTGIEYTRDLEISLHGERSQGTIGTALHSGRYDVCNDLSSDPRMLPWRDGAAQWGFRATASFPLKIEGGVIGALVLFAAEIGYFLEDEVDLMVTIAEELSFAIEAIDKAAQREATQAALRASEASLTEAQHIAGLGNWEWNPACNELRWSQEIYRNLGLPLGTFADVLPAHRFFDAVHPDDVTAVRAALKHSLKSGAPCDFEYRIVREDGGERVVHTRGQVFTDASGRTERIAGTAQDVTERRAAELRLRSSEELLRIAGQTARIGGWTFDVASRQLTMSDVVADIRELPAGTVLNIETALDLYAPEWVDVITMAFKRCLDEGTPYDLEIVILTAKGRRVWVRTMGRAVRDSSGTIVRVQGAFQDISERKRAEDQSRRLAERLTATLESITDAFFTLDTDWRFTYVNPESERLMRQSRSLLLGKSIWEMFPEVVGSTFEMEYRRAMSKRCTVEFVQHYVPLNLWAEVRAYPSDDGLAVYFRDVTERKQAEMELLRAEQTRAAIFLLQQEMNAPLVDRESAVALVAERTCALTEADGSAVELIDGDQLEMVTAAGTLADFVGLKLPRDKSLSGSAVDSGEVMLSADADVDARIDRTLARHVGARSLIAAPLRDGERIVGVLKVVSAQPRKFTNRDVSTVQIISESLGALLQRQRAAEALRASESQYRLLFDSNPHPMWVFDIASLRFLAVNSAAVKHYGYSADEFLAMTIRHIHPPELVPRLERSISGKMDEKRDLGAWRHARKDGSIIDVEITSDRIVFNGQAARLVLAHDITDRVRADRDLARVSRAQRMLSRCIEAQIRAEEETALLTEICNIAVEGGGYRMAWVGYARHDVAHSIVPVAHAGDDTGYLSDVVLTWSENDPRGMGPAGQTIRSGQATIATDITAESAHFHWHARAAACGYRGVICLPLREGERTFGLLGLYMAEVQSISAEEVELLQQLADDLAFGIGNLRSQNERKLLQTAVLKVAAGVSAGTGAAFFEQLTRSMTEAVGADAGYVVRLDAGDPTSAHCIMAVDGGQVAANFSYRVHGTPCANLLESGQCLVPEQVAERYPDDPMLREMDVEAYVGWRLDNSQGRPIGLLYVVYRRPLERSEFVVSTLKIFAARAAAELERLDSDARIREQASLLDQAQDAIVVHRLPDHQILYWNQGAQRLFGWTSDEALGQPMDKLLQIAVAEAQLPLQRVLDHGEWNGEFHERRKDGSAILAEVRCTLVRDASEQPRSILSIMSDITERRRTETGLQQALIDLNNRNRELQDFAFVASHDLQEPLRKIRMFSDRLALHAAGVLDAQAQDYLQRSAAAAERMQTLINDLLTYSRIGSGERRFEPIALGPLLATVVDDLQERVESSSATVVIGPLPTVQGDRTLLRQLFQNLIANALKFHVRERAPVVNISSRSIITENGNPAFLINVADNGIGFDPKYAERIFSPFQRLHTSEKFEGTGIGLAIVRRIVDRHQGQISVKTELGKGATFSVLLPQSLGAPGARPTNGNL